MTAPHLQPIIGPFSATMLGVGAMVGAGIFVLSGSAAGLAGPAVILAFIFNGIAAFAIGACYAELASTMPRAGGSYYWVKQTLGRPAGFAVGWISLYANAVASALYALGFGSFMVALLQRLGLVLPEIMNLIFALFLSVTVTYVQFRGIKDLRAIENIVTLTKIFLLLVLVAGGASILLTKPEPLGAFSPFAPNGLQGVLLAMAVLFVAFEGFEVITRTGEEIINPERNIPRAIFASIFLVVILYLCVSFILIAVVTGTSGEASWEYLGVLGELGMATAAVQLLPSGDIIFYVAGIASTASAMIAATFSAIRVSFALGRGGDLSSRLATLHPTHNSPYVASLLCGAIVIFMVISLPLHEVAGAASQMFALLFTIVCFSCWRLRITQPTLKRPYKAPWLKFTASAGMIISLTVIIVLLDISPLAWTFSCLWLLAGFVIYLLKHYKKTTD